jgi:hypothetical protein
VALNLSPQEGETEGFSPETHLEVLATHAPGLRLDVVLADTGSVADPGSLRQVAESFGARLLVAAVAADDGSRSTTRYDWPRPTLRPSRTTRRTSTTRCTSRLSR